MPKFEVSKPFNTDNRRMAVGAPVEASDDLTPFTVEERRESGYLRVVGEEVVAQPQRSPRAPSPAALAEDK